MKILYTRFNANDKNVWYCGCVHIKTMDMVFVSHYIEKEEGGRRKEEGEKRKMKREKRK